MYSPYSIIVVVMALVIIGFILGQIFSQHKHLKKFEDKFGADDDHTDLYISNELKAQTELYERQKQIDTQNIRSFSNIERERYLEDWAAIQSKFDREPGKTIESADRFIMEVMRLLRYPVSDFEQREAEISANYPAFVNNYRAARAIATKNKQHQADAEDFRLAMINYQNLFEELLEQAADFEPENHSVMVNSYFPQ